MTGLFRINKSNILFSVVIFLCCYVCMTQAQADAPALPVDPALVETSDILTSAEAQFLFSTEREYLDAINNRAVPVPDTSSWKFVSLGTSPTQAKLQRSLTRISKDVLNNFNKLTNTHKFTGCTNYQKVQLNASQYGIQYKFRCTADVSGGLPSRPLDIWVWDRFGVVELLGVVDHLEKSEGFSADIDGWYFDQIQIPGLS